MKRSFCPQLARTASSFIVFFCVAVQPAPAQQSDEPILAQLREVFNQPGLRIGALFQAVVDPGFDGGTASAQVATARLLASGVLDGGFRYELQTNFAASPSLLDARVGWTWNEGFAVDAGRFKTPFSRELLTFAGSIDFVNRSRVVEALAPNRQIGMRLSGAFNERFSWAAGGFTGGSNNTPNESLIGVVRFEGSDLELGDGRLALGAQGALGRDGAVGGPIYGGGFVGDGTLVGVDGRFELGRLTLGAEFIRADWESAGSLESDADGLYLTAGWMFVEDSQALVRWDRYRSPSGVDDDALVLGYNVWPTEASEIQVNGIVPLRGSELPYQLLVNFQIGF